MKTVGRIAGCPLEWQKEQAIREAVRRAAIVGVSLPLADIALRRAVSVSPTVEEVKRSLEALNGDLPD